MSGSPSGTVVRLPMTGGAGEAVGSATGDGAAGRGSGADPRRPDPKASPVAADPRSGVRRGAAQNPSTPPEVLARLACDGNFWVRCDAAANPSTPRELLELLRRAGSAPDLSAPAEPDPTLEPEALARLAAAGEWGRRLAARHPAAAPILLATLAGDPSARIRADVARHPGAEAELLTRLLEDEEPTVRRAAAGHPAVPTLALERLRQAGAGEELDGAGTPEPTLAPEDLTLLARGGPFARRLAARHPNLPASLLAALAGNQDRETRRGVASHPGCAAQLLARLAEDDDPETRQAVARHPAATPEILTRLAADEEAGPDLLRAVAEHPATPVELLELLAGHGASWVREAVAAHPTFRGPLERLFRRAGSRNDLMTHDPPDPTLPAADLIRLARGGGWARRLAARHPATPPVELSRLAADGDLFARREAARHPRTPPEVLDLLVRAGSTPELDGLQPSTDGLRAADFSTLVGLGPWGERLAARHPEAPAELLDRLAGHGDPQIRIEVAANPATGESTLEALSQDVSPAVRWAVVQRPQLPRQVLLHLAKDPLPTLRAAVARHPEAGPELLYPLLHDLDEDVRAVVRERVGGG